MIVSSGLDTVSMTIELEVRYSLFFEVAIYSQL